jgi:DNA-binding transcriptional LysR family regulator
MTIAHIRRADLNLLVVFQTLMSERHVGRAAVRLGLTQSGVSHALARLRDLVGDPLFVRHPKGIEPTPKAIALGPVVADVLSRASSIFASGSGFDPTTSHAFTIGGADLGVFSVALPLITRLRASAPAIDVRIRSLDGSRVIEAFDRQEIDLALMPFNVAMAPFHNEPARIKREPVLRERNVGIARKGHTALAKGALTAAAFAALPHLLISPRGEVLGEADARLAELGLKRRIVMVVPHFLAAPLIVARTDMVTVIAERVALHFASQLPLVLFEPPVAMTDFTIDLLISASRADDAALRWLRQEISLAVEDTHAEKATSQRERRITRSVGRHSAK